ncbi:GNAT family N-acetyltransferase [Sporosarcina ureae]|uniref:GNAT family N-acetyltransferase n=1 Tax=Sporosarcina ureae TaxID=1571 RepID=UPI0009DC591C|nr:GNAT family N-acetyltransferase [Sporosarcina ureae]ARF17769.1 acetyltransferase [Sporosarcina ureae]
MGTLRQTVKLEKYNPEFLKALREFELPTEKAQYTAFPAVILEKLTDDQYPIVILSNDEPVGFFLLQSTDRVKEFTDNPRALLLTALSIDNSKQGKGFAKEAMNLIKQFVNQELPEYDEIILAVNHKNIPAQNLYKRVGFSDTGKRKIGKIGEQFIFNTYI